MTSLIVPNKDSFRRTEDRTRLLPFCALWSIHNFRATECDDSFPSLLRRNTDNRTELFENISSNNAPLFHNIHNNCSVESNGQVFVYVTFLLLHHLTSMTTSSYMGANSSAHLVRWMTPHHQLQRRQH